jgi:hypothetical protein
MIDLSEEQGTENGTIRVGAPSSATSRARAVKPSVS